MSLQEPMKPENLMAADLLCPCFEALDFDRLLVLSWVLISFIDNKGSFNNENIYHKNFCMLVTLRDEGISIFAEIRKCNYLIKSMIIKPCKGRIWYLICDGSDEENIMWLWWAVNTLPVRDHDVNSLQGHKVFTVWCQKWRSEQSIA